MIFISLTSHDKCSWRRCECNLLVKLLQKSHVFPEFTIFTFLNSVLWFFRNYSIHFSDCMITTAILTLPFLTSSCNRDYLTAQYPAKCQDKEKRRPNKQRIKQPKFWMVVRITFSIIAPKYGEKRWKFYSKLNLEILES